METIFINPKALQLSIIMLRQYQPAIAKLLPGPERYPVSGDDIPLQLDYQKVTQIISALSTLGEKWFEEAKQQPKHSDRNRLRKQCLSFILEEWIDIGEQYQRQPQYLLH